MNISFFTVWPGCEMVYSASDYGKVETDWAKLAHHRITFIPRDLTENDLITASKHAVRGFYLRPRIIFEMLSSITSLYAIHSIIKGFIAFLNTLNRRNSHSGGN